jgi:hypothetical protein
MPRPADRIPRHPTNTNTYTVPVPRLPFDFMRPTKLWAWPPTTHRVLITKSTHRGMLQRPGRFAICKQIRCFLTISNAIPAFPWPTWSVILGLSSAWVCGKALPILTPLQPSPSSRSFAGKLSLSSSCQQTRPSLYGKYVYPTIGEFSRLPLNATAAPVAPWTSREESHSDFSRVG